MKTTTTTDRATEIRTELTRAEADLAAARERLGIAVADGDKSAADNAREDATTAERLASELRSALPVAERRAREAAQAEAQRQRRASEKAANTARKARLSAARKVDAALLTLGKAYTDYMDTAPGGRPEDANRLARRSRHAIAAATFAAASAFAEAMEPRHRPSRQHWQSLTRAVEGSVGEFEAEPEAEPAS